MDTGFSVRLTIFGDYTNPFLEWTACQCQDFCYHTFELISLKNKKEMLKTFRCQDLANLLAFANHSKNGKKCELYERCVKLLEKGGVHIQQKIQEIYR